MKLLIVGSVALLLASCAAIAQSPPTASPSSIPQVITGDEANSARRERLTLRLTLTTPDDLKVREGDRVSEGDVLSDRTRDRERLKVRQQQLSIQIARLKQPIVAPPTARAIPEVAGLPPASFLDEVAEVERQRVMVRTAEATMTQQQRMLDLLRSMPSANLPEATIPHEEEKLKQSQQALEQTRAELELAQAKLTQAQADRQYEEYLHSMEMSKRAIAIEQQRLERQSQMQTAQAGERDRSFQLAQLELQAEQIEMQLITLSAVRSPFTGRIQRIKWEGQNDQNLVVELTLIAGGTGGDGAASRNETRPDATPTPKPQP